MYRIGEFSMLSKTTIKTLRYYEKEQLLIPSFVDETTGYRFYEATQLVAINKIISLRQIGMSIDNIRSILNGDDLHMLLLARKQELETMRSITADQLSRITYLLKGDTMKYEAIVKEVPEYIVYYKEGVIQDFSELSAFILGSEKDCRAVNPNLKCIEPDYCYVNYLDGEFKEKNIHILYAQAVVKEGIGSDTIHFKTLKPVQVLSVYHQGAYEKLGEAYAFGTKWIEDNGYEMIDFPRECYIDGIWNKEKVEDWITEIQFPIKKK